MKTKDEINAIPNQIFLALALGIQPDEITVKTVAKVCLTFADDNRKEAIELIDTVQEKFAEAMEESLKMLEELQKFQQRPSIFK